VGSEFDEELEKDGDEIDFEFRCLLEKALHIYQLNCTGHNEKLGEQ
jgi:hypothetical protein